MVSQTQNSKKIVLDLCGGTGSWARPYFEAGYNVITITLPVFDVRESFLRGDGCIVFPSNQSGKFIAVDRKDVYGVLAAPPCTMFSFARTNAKKPRDLKEGMECVRACLDIIWSIKEIKQETGKKTLPLKFWALENPYHGFLPHFLGKPSFTFDPWEFGDAYKKRTAIWGFFNEPKKTVTDINKVLTKQQQQHKTNSQPLPKFDFMKSKDIHPEMFGKADRQTRRSITPQGFAKAFYQYNK